MHIKLNDIKIIILFSPKCFLLFFWAFAVLLLCHWGFFCIYCYQLMYMYTLKKYSIYCKEVNRIPVMKNCHIVGALHVAQNHSTSHLPTRPFTTHYYFNTSITTLKHI